MNLLWFPDGLGNDGRELRWNFLLLTNVMNTDDMILTRALVQSLSKHRLVCTTADNM